MCSYTNFSGRGTAAIAGGRASSSVLYGWPCYARRRQQQQPDTAGCGVRSLFCVIRRVSEMAAFLISILCTFCLKSYLGNEHTALSSIVSVPESATVNCRSRSVSAPLNRSLARSLAASQKTEIEVLSSSITSTQYIHGREYTFYFYPKLSHVGLRCVSVGYNYRIR